MWADYKAAKNAARELLRENNINKPPVDPVEVAKKAGLDVVFAKFAPEDDSIAGFYDPFKNSITINRHEFPLRQNFTIAHELGHHVLHRDWARTAEYKMYRDPELNNDNRQEKEANKFAACLLVPRVMLNRYWDKYSVEDLSEMFAVSVPVIKNRISTEYGVVFTKR